jgi:hypothetical protein
MLLSSPVVGVLERPAERAVVFLAVLLRAVLFRAVVLRAVVFRAVLLRAPDVFALDFRAGVLFAAISGLLIIVDWSRQ